MIRIDEIDYSVFGKCLHISNGSIELVVTLDFGPRIIRAAYVGKDNFMFEDTAGKFIQDVGNGQVFHNYGGHRLWIAPETFPDTYYPDNEAVGYSINGNTVTFTPPTQETGFTLKLDVTMDEAEDKVNLRHYVTNNGNCEQRIAPWAISMLANGGHLMIPVNDNDTGYLPNRYVVMWPYTKMNDPRVNWGDKFIVMDQTQEQAVNMDCPFKIGMSQIQSWAVYVKNNSMFMKRYTFYPDAEYPDGNCSFETYSCSDFIEMETVGTYKNLAVGDTAVHDEVWCFFDKADIKI